MCGFSIFAFGDEQAIGGICLIGMGLLCFGFAAFMGKTLSSGPQFVTLSDEGVNINNKAVFLWDDIETVKEEDVNIRARGITIKKKQILFRYADQQSGKIVSASIMSDFEGYHFIREKVKKYTGSKFVE